MNGYDKIPEERKQQLDALFEAFSIIGDDTYVYLCDMQYDFSRWSKVLTDDLVCRVSICTVPEPSGKNMYILKTEMPSIKE